MRIVLGKREEMAVNLLSKELVSPVVNEDRSVTFNFKSAQAEKVEISGEFRLGRKVVGPGAPVTSVPMEKTSDKVWTYTTKPVPPGIYRYTFIVDGMRILDPLNPWRRYHRVQPMSMVEVKGEEPMPWDQLPRISHGTVVIEKFYSETLEQVKSCAIYLPPSYWATEKRFPVFYLLHGGGDDYGSWVFDGNADNIMDYLISKGKSKEMVVVMPDGQIISLEERMRLRSLRGRSSAIRRVIRSMVSERHLDYFVKELMPFVESRYRISKEQRAIAGLSMGGAQTFNLITSYPDMFMAAGMFSSGPAEKARKRLPLVKDKIELLKLIYVSCGNWDSILENSRALNHLLEELKVPHIYVEGEGGHIWSFWQRSLIDFVTRLSQIL